MIKYIFIFTLFSFNVGAQAIDKVIAVVGNHYVLESELRIRLREEKLTLGPDPEAAACKVLHGMIQEKLLLHQAALDSVEIGDDEVEAQLEQRFNYFVMQFGSEQAMEQYFDKTIDEIKEDLRTSLKESLTVNRMRGQLFGDIKASPNEVRKFFRSIPYDSLPNYPTEYEIGQIVIKVGVSADAKDATINKLRRIRRDILTGREDFEFAATFYSEDPGSQPKGGDLGTMSRNDFVPEFSAAAFKLKKDSISDVVETQFGYHLIKLINRTGENIHLKHILIKPKITQEDRVKAKKLIDSVRLAIVKDTLTFEQAAYLFSDDEETKNNGGMMFDPQTAATKIPVQMVDPAVLYVIDNMKVNTMSEAFPMRTREGAEAYRILFLKGKYAPHRANLNQDYPRISEMAAQKKTQKELDAWCLRKIPTVFMRVDEKYAQCPAIAKLILNP